MTSQANVIRLYRHPLSGHCHRVELLLAMLGLDIELVDIDLAKGAHKQPEFLAKNPFGQVPVLEDGEITLFDSNAILVYLASRYDASHQWLPTDPVEASQVQRNLTLAAGEIAFGAGAARLVTVFGAKRNHQEAIDRAHAVLRVIDAQLAGRQWLASDHVTIADLANYSYIAHAPEGGVSLETYPNVRSWLQRVEGLPGFVPMQATSAGLAA